MSTAEFRFYEELNDYLRVAWRKCAFTHAFAGTPAVKDVIEALGVPHTEIDIIRVDGKSVRFSQRLRGGERVAVYPMFERFDIRPLHRLRPKPLRRTRFVADVHLGPLARYLRLLGFDTRYATDLDDAELVGISVRERRILLTRDVGLLKQKALTHGYRLRSTDSDRQLEEVVPRPVPGEGSAAVYALYVLQRRVASGRPRRSCGPRAAGDIQKVSPVHLLPGLPQRIYWRGTHFKQLELDCGATAASCAARIRY